MVGDRVGRWTRGRVGLALRFAVGATMVAALVHWAGPSLAAVGDADPRLVAAAAVGSAGALYCLFEAFYRAVRTVAPGATRRVLVGPFLGATFARNATPAGMLSGVAVGAHLAGRRTGASSAHTLGALAVLEVLTTVASALAAATGLVGVAVVDRASVPGLAEAGTAVGSVALLAAAGAVVFVVRDQWVIAGTFAVTDLARRSVSRVSPASARRLSREALSAQVENVRAAIRVAAADRRATAGTFAVTYAAWLCFGASLYAACAGLGAPVSPSAALLAVPVAGLAGILPTPGGVGGVEVVLVGVLAALATAAGAGAGADVGTLTAAVLVFRGVTYWFHLGVGALGVVAGWTTVDAAASPSR